MIRCQIAVMTPCTKSNLAAPYYNSFCFLSADLAFFGNFPCKSQSLSAKLSTVIYWKKINKLAFEESELVFVFVVVVMTVTGYFLALPILRHV